jgi:hypothetical protein
MVELGTISRRSDQWRPSQRRSRQGPGWALVDAAAIPALLSLSVVDTGRFLNRETIRVRGVPQKAAAIEAPLALLRDHPLVELGMGADEYVLTVDRTTGVLLRSEASVFGQPFKIIEALDFVVDEVLSAETFVLNLPAGVAFEEALPPQVRPPHRSRILRLLGRRPDPSLPGRLERDTDRNSG